MFHKILVAIDRSETSRRGFEAALSLARATGASLVLLHILSLDDEESPRMPNLFGKDFYPRHSSRTVGQIYEELWQAYEQRGNALLTGLAEEAIAQGVATEFVQGMGSPGSAICEFARQLGADLVVLGRQGYSGFNEFVLGSVSNYVLHHAPCAVLVVHRDAEAIAAPTSEHQVVTAP